MIDTDKYEGHTEGKWYAETGANGEVQDTATVEIVSFHSDEFREKWLADASLRHEKQQDEHSIGDRTEALVSILGQVYQPDDEGSWFNENNRLMLDGEMQANMNLMADAPLILQALIDERAEVKRLREELGETEYRLEMAEEVLGRSDWNTIYREIIDEVIE